MSVITKVSFEHPDMALAGTIGTVPDLDLSVLPEVGTDPEHDRYFLQVEDGDIDRIRDALTEDHTVQQGYSTFQYGDTWIIGLQFTPETKLLAPSVTDMGGIVIEAKTGPSGWIERWQFPDREAVHGLWEYAHEESFRFDILELYRSDESLFEGSLGLTDPQTEAILTAYNNGYFKEPRDVSLEDLANELDISPSAASGRLRRGIEKLVETNLADHRGEDFGGS